MKNLWFRLMVWLGIAKVESLEIEYTNDEDREECLAEAERLRKELGIPVKVIKGKDYGY